MDRPLAKRTKPSHLICRSGWALVLTCVCAFFAYRTFASIRVHDYELPHNWWDVLTWAVWALLSFGLVSEVRCWRERVLFGSLLVQFLIGCVFSVWASAPSELVALARQVSLALWCLSVLLAFSALLAKRRDAEA